MSKKLIFMAMLILAGLARAEYLFWTLDPVSQDRLKFAYLQVAALDGDGNNVGYLTVGDGSQTILWDEGTIPETTQMMETYSLIPENYTGQYDGLGFMIELYNLQGVVIGISQIASYTDLLRDGYIFDKMGTAGIADSFHYIAHVPEPTGGMLFLIGFGLLSLRRKTKIGEVVK